SISAFSQESFFIIERKVSFFVAQRTCQLIFQPQNGKARRSEMSGNLPNEAPHRKQQGMRTIRQQGCEFQMAHDLKHGSKSNKD
ncbi:MAG: hypothetical protein JZU70_01050, partial [Chlorobium sp.]|nr:hypothetical protein [Chlorobium sp.]